MNKNSNSTTWIVATFCAIIVFTALGVVTDSLVQQSQTKITNETEAYKQERIRLAMWRLDTLAANIVRSEDDRSVYEFKNPEAEKLPEQLKQKVNGLYFSSPEISNLYWNLRPSTQDDVVSPQVYNTDYLITNNIIEDNNSIHQYKLQSLERILSEKLKAAKNDPLHAISDNKSLTYAVAKVSLENWGVNQNRSYPEGNDFSYRDQANSQQEIVDNANAPLQQEMLSKADKDSRVKAISRVNPTNKVSAWNANYASKEAAKKDNTSKSKAVKPTKKLMVKPTEKPLPTLVHQAEEPFSTPFFPLWLDGELMLVRKVTEPSGDSVQGVWINSEKLISLLLAEISDLFPDATLAPVAQDLSKLLAFEESNSDPTTMVKFPLKLIPNEPIVAKISTTSYIYGPIGLAWLATLFAILAGYFMLRSVVNMSERRASFVSSVTHELRTPLTTFRLYSELLATGMVSDPEKQKSYLETLKHESERLSHLVENVLSYSQIERGSAKAKLEKTTLSNLINRIEPRLSERIQEEEMHLSIDYTETIGNEQVTVDITAVEQIVFNLVDNACKYASGDGYGDQIQIRLKTDKKMFTIEVCDQGPGIPTRESKKLFKPFHKSAKQAADTKPGVGLGLALCRRLAKAMKGNLVINHRSDKACEGACFQLKLPKE